MTSGEEAAGAGGQDRDHQLAVSLQKQDAEAVSRDCDRAEFKQRHLGARQEEAGSLNKRFEVSKAGMPWRWAHWLPVNHVQKKVSMK